jgi:hypothetical protein
MNENEKKCGMVIEPEFEAAINQMECEVKERRVSIELAEITAYQQSLDAVEKNWLLQCGSL